MTPPWLPMTPIFYHRICFSYKNVNVCKKTRALNLYFWPCYDNFKFENSNFQFFPKIGLSDKNCENLTIFQRGKHGHEEVLSKLTFYMSKIVYDDKRVLCVYHLSYSKNLEKRSSFHNFCPIIQFSEKIEKYEFLNLKLS